MGGDGGSLNNSRMELVRVRKEMMGQKGKSCVEKDVRERDRWTTCAISREKLSSPIVACRLGYLYNKEQLIRFLRDKHLRKRMSEFSHLRSLKDVVDCKLDFVTDGKAVFRCPFTLREALGGQRFVVLWGCGHVVSEGALIELGKQKNVCISCEQRYEEKVVLHPCDEIRKELRAELEVRFPRKRKDREQNGTKDRQKNESGGAETKAPKLSSESSVYASLFTSGDDHAHNSNARGSFTGVSLRPSGV
eukprot:Plantae.Rhodophyta-Purpureofilum_apyrenoidigerum.ctg392.p1 GENE.Plantae.Rhodophyta-Purpureofilum_apyrenoidigerum.ctg392~~Plantae.Rhodophyta-Purpureofilum_apyrenoidigerum.ctg392.p1  ORF type:complete len:248 (+),score=35.15 Plantae.Rhodophyta-Purpureofilum_apyrenoidigerum.ctg392:111-854(+)